eukprot:Skav203382  [mRNA]  locus=scaffold1379:228580:239126:+ [translate_table: standard]
MTCSIRSDKHLQKITDIKIPGWAVGPTALNLLCERGVEGLEKLEPASFGSGRVKAEEQSAKTEKPSEIRVIKRAPPSKAPAENSENPSEVKRQKTMAEQSKPDQPKPATEDVEQLVEAAMEKVKDRKRKQAERDREIAAKSLLKKKGLDFNSHFQTAHRGMAKSPQHWKTFLAGVMGASDIQCTVCQNLIREFRVDAFEEPEPSEPVETETDAPTDPPQDALALQLVPAGSQYTPPKKRSKAGRPKKHDDRRDPPFDLVKYIESKRAGQYRWLEADEAFQRLEKVAPEKARVPYALEMEMKKNPVQCLVCRTIGECVLGELRQACPRAGDSPARMLAWLSKVHYLSPESVALLQQDEEDSD